MLDRKLHRFFLSYKLNANIETAWVEGINLRHAKDKLQMKFPDATDLMDWTNEKPEDFEKYKNKYLQSKKSKWEKLDDFPFKLS